MRRPRRVDVNVVAAVSLDTLREMMQHMEWADACVWRAVLAHRAAVQDTRLRDLLFHLHGVQRAFGAGVGGGSLLLQRPLCRRRVVRRDDASATDRYAGTRAIRAAHEAPVRRTDARRDDAPSRESFDVSPRSSERASPGGWR
jgi:hypothetical protein